MGLHHLDHYNIETVNLDETIKFYCDVLGLYVGDRPPLPFPGAWLYCENKQPTIHLIGTNPGEPDRPKVPAGKLHHICFATTGIDEVRERLEKANIKFNKVVLPRSPQHAVLHAGPQRHQRRAEFPGRGDEARRHRNVGQADQGQVLACTKRHVG